MIINLHSYAEELDVFTHALEPFLDGPSHARYNNLVERLKQCRDNTKCENFAWSTQESLTTIRAECYDGRGRRSEPVTISVGIDGHFTRDTAAAELWSIDRLITHLSVIRPDDDQPSLQFHIDQKNEGQLGPPIHMQVSERFLGDFHGHRLAVPRFPIVTLLPTDCFDFLLSEFFPHHWSASQAGLWRITFLRQQQKRRICSVARELHAAWRKTPKRTFISFVQDSSLAGLQLA